MAKVRNHVPPFPCFEISAPIVLFQRERGQLHSLRFVQDIPLTKKENQGNFQEIMLT